MNQERYNREARKAELGLVTCCDCGSYAHQTPMAVAGRVVWVDYCIADIVAALNAANIRTVASCCGHGKRHGSVLLADGRELVICEGRYDTT